MLPLLQNEQGSAAQKAQKAKKQVSSDNTKIKWTRGLIKRAALGETGVFNSSNITEGLYRPFVKSNLYYSSQFNEYTKSRLWPTPAHDNRVIQVITTGANAPFTCLMSDCIVDLNVLTGGQCHPLYYYEKLDGHQQADMLAEGRVYDGYIRHDAITNMALVDFRSHYDDDSITKEGIFYYIYGVLHSPEYRQRYRADLKKEAPRVPYALDFHAFRVAGEKLAELHTDYESIEPYELDPIGWTVRSDS